MADSTPQTLGRYTIHAELGKGGFATVYRATDTTLERDVALKILKPGWTDDAKAVERFMREAKQASRLKHSNIVTIFDVGQAEGRLFIAMELVRGRSLQQIITEDGAMAWPRMLAILEQSAAALDYAHKQGLIHRDIKPANIILDESEPGTAVHAILTDFGLVRGAEQASLSMGTTGGLLGTPEYIPPEIWDGEPATKASDIYALGCVAFYLLTGKVLFSATTPMAVLKRHAEGPVFSQQWPDGVPTEAEAILRRALAKEPTQRPASAAEFVSELRACEGLAVQAEAAREQEAKQKEESERAAQAALALAAARKVEEERARQEAERKAKEEADRRAREEQERQRQTELAAQAAAAEKVKQEAAERERQKQAREAAKLAEEEARRTELAASRPPVAAQPVQSTQTATPATKAKANRTWLYIAGGVITLIVVAILFASTRLFTPTATPAPAVQPTKAPAVQPTAVPAQPTAAPAQPTEAPAQPTEAPAVSSLTGEVTLWKTYGEGSLEDEALKQAVAQLQSDNPNLKVNVLHIPFDQIENKWTTEIVAGGGPDMFTMPNDSLGTWARGNVVAPIDDLMKDHLQDFSKAGIDGLTVDGRLYGVPGIIKAVALYYNKSTVSDPPTTTDELLNLVRSGKQIGIYATSYHNFGWLVNAFGGKLMNDNGKCIADQDSGMADALQFMVDLKNAGAKVQSDGANTEFRQGQVDMIIDGPWYLGDFKQDLSDNLAVAAMPAGPNGPATPLSGIDGWYINPNITDEQKNLAVEVALYLFGPKGAGYWANIAGDPVVAKDVSVSDPLVRAFADAASAGVPRPQSQEFPNYWGPFQDAMTNVLEGRSEPAAAVAEACAAMNKASGK